MASRLHQRVPIYICDTSLAYYHIIGPRLYDVGVPNIWICIKFYDNYLAGQLRASDRSSTERWEVRVFRPLRVSRHTKHKHDSVKHVVL